MSGNAEDEAKARLEVAQLYEGMPGQAGKAARYYLAAAEIYRTAGVHQRARELYNKVIQLEPGNAQATQALNNMVAAAGGAAPAAAPPRPVPTSVPLQIPGAAAQAAPAPAAPEVIPAQGSSGGRVMIPTPWISREPRYVAAARGQLHAPPERRDFPWDPLPTVDPEKVAKRAEERKTVQKEAERKTQKAVPSVFGGEGSGRFSAPAAPAAGGGAGKFGAPPSGGSGKFGAPPAAASAPAPAAPSAPQQPPPSRFTTGPVDIRGGNRDLADAIRKRLQGG